MSMDFSALGRGLLGLVCILLIAFVFSKDRRAIKKRIIVAGLAFVSISAFLMIKVPWIRGCVELVGAFFVRLVDFSDQGAAFLFGDLVLNTKSYGYIFAFHILPNIIFFSALCSLLYYFKVLPKVVKAFAWLLTRTLHLSGAECAAAAANIFLGQVTAPILIKPYLPKMSRAEMFSVMTSGMATISGSVMLGCVALLGDAMPEKQLDFATYLVTASILSAPAALMIAHIMCPKTGPVEETVSINTSDQGLNAFDAVVQGGEEGLRVSLSIGATMIVFISCIHMINWGLTEGITNTLPFLNTWVETISGGNFTHLNLEAIFGLLFAPVAWLLGVAKEDIFIVGELLGQKVVLNEFVAYISLADNLKTGALTNSHSITISTFALCSFANFASIGVQITGFSAMASNQRVNVSQLALLAVISGNLACFTGTCIAGMLL